MEAVIWLFELIINRNKTKMLLALIAVSVCGIILSFFVNPLHLTILLECCGLSVIDKIYLKALENNNFLPIKILYGTDNKLSVMINNVLKRYWILIIIGFIIGGTLFDFCFNGFQGGILKIGLDIIWGIILFIWSHLKIKIFLKYGEKSVAFGELLIYIAISSLGLLAFNVKLYVLISILCLSSEWVMYKILRGKECEALI